jgi:hypothetical protein
MAIEGSSSRASHREAALRPSGASAALAGALLLAGCGSVPTVTTDSGVGNTRQVLTERAEQGPVLAAVVGNPYAMDEARLDGMVTDAMAAGITGLGVDFTTDPSQAAAAEPRLVVVLDPAGDPSGDAVCRNPTLVQTQPAGEELQVLAAFCDGADALGSVVAQDTVGGPTDRRFQRLLWRTASALFPDDYAETYGFGLLPNSFDFGFGGGGGGGEPPLGDDPLAPPEDFDPLAPEPPE